MRLVLFDEIKCSTCHTQILLAVAVKLLVVDFSGCKFEAKKTGRNYHHGCLVSSLRVFEEGEE